MQSSSVKPDRHLVTCCRLLAVTRIRAGKLAFALCLDVRLRAIPCCWCPPCPVYWEGGRWHGPHVPPPHLCSPRTGLSDIAGTISSIFMASRAHTGIARCTTGPGQLGSAWRGRSCARRGALLGSALEGCLSPPCAPPKGSHSQTVRPLLSHSALWGEGFCQFCTPGDA